VYQASAPPHITLATEHYGIHIMPPFIFKATIVVATCRNCGHGICPGCGDWCDTLIGPGLDQCCNGECWPTLEETTIHIVASQEQLVQQWQTQATELIARLRFESGANN